MGRPPLTEFNALAAEAEFVGKSSKSLQEMDFAPASCRPYD